MAQSLNSMISKQTLYLQNYSNLSKNMKVTINFLFIFFVFCHRTLFNVTRYQHYNSISMFPQITYSLRNLQHLHTITKVRKKKKDTKQGHSCHIYVSYYTSVYISYTHVCMIHNSSLNAVFHSNYL